MKARWRWTLRHVLVLQQRKAGCLLRMRGRQRCALILRRVRIVWKGRWWLRSGWRVVVSLGRRIRCRWIMSLSIRRRGHGRRGPAIAMRLAVLGWIRGLVMPVRVRVAMLRNHVRWLLHGSSRQGRSLVCLAHARLGVHALDRNDAAESGIRRWLGEVGLTWLRARIVRDEVKVLTRGRRDAKRLLHQTVGLVSISFWLAIIVVLVATAA